MTTGKITFRVFSALGVTLGLCGISLAGSDSMNASSPIDGVQPITFVEIEHQREFTGQMIVRPLQMKQLQQEQRMSQKKASQIHQQAADAIAAYALREYVTATDEYIIFVPAGQTEADVANDLMATDLFQYAEPNWRVYPVDCPDDPMLNQQYQHNSNIMQSCDAWDLTPGDPSISVGICDTGIYVDHEDLLERRLEGYNAVDKKWESEGGSINDINGHGTGTTGCAAANGNNGIGVAGTGLMLSHRMMRVSNSSGGGSDLGTLTHAARTSIENGDKVANVSYSGVDNQTVLTAGTYIKSLDGLLVWSAGNDGRNLTLGNRDADDVIVVGATDSSDSKAGFSAYGQFVDLVAPGVDVMSTTSSGGYGKSSGTSFSAPLTAGLIALIWSANPTLSADDVETFLKLGVDDLGSSGVDDTFGYGRINSFNSVTLALVPLKFTYLSGPPILVEPTGGTRLRIQIEGQAETPVEGSGLLHWRENDGDWNESALEYLDHDLYQGVFGTADCGSTIEFYVTVDTVEGNTLSYPAGAPNALNSAIAATRINESLVDSFETDQGWTVVNENIGSGGWERAIPINNKRQDPEADADGNDWCFVTDNSQGNSDVDGGPTRLTSPQFDATDADVLVTYEYWFSQAVVDSDVMEVEISNDFGANWTLVEALSDTSGGRAPEWRTAHIRVVNHIVPTDQMLVRFSVADNPNNSITEAGLDNVVIGALDCSGDPDPCIFLTVDNLTGGEQATFTVSGGIPGRRAVTVYAFEYGETNVFEMMEYCAEFGLQGISTQRVIGGLNRRFNAGGEMSFRKGIPISAVGMTVLFQSAMEKTCPTGFPCMTNIVEQVIQ